MSKRMGQSKWEAIRQRVFERDNWECVQCGSGDDLHLDHIIPLAKWGDGMDPTHMGNYQTLCQYHNLIKSDDIQTRLNWYNKAYISKLPNPGHKREPLLSRHNHKEKEIV